MRDAMLKLRVTPDEAARWRDAATAAGHHSLSAWLRGLAELAAAGGVDAPAVRAELVGLRSELARGVGNNLNQIARAMHVDEKAGRPADAHAVAVVAASGDVAAMRARVDAVLSAITPRRSTS